ncbi:MAG: efflux RND transporter periplasmic adaptor subunit [Bacteroidales bacterium]
MDRAIKKKKWPLKKVLWLGAAVALVLLVGYYIIFADKSSKLNVDVEKLTIESVQEDLYRDYITVIGTVAPIQTIYLDATEGGSRVEEIVTQEGGRVEEGDIIARFSNTNLILDISNFEANVSRANNELSSIRLQMERQTLETQSRLLDLNFELKERKRKYNTNNVLFEQDHISKEEYERSKEAYELTQKRIELFRENAKQDSLYRLTQLKILEEDAARLQSNLSIVRSRLDALVFRAPVSGELASLDLEVGQVIGMGSRIGTIHVLDSYKLKVDVDEHYINRVIHGLKGNCEFGGKQYLAQISKIYPEVRSGRFTVDMEFDSLVPKNIRIGQTSRIRLELGESQMATLIPRGGFYQSTGGQWIFVVDPSGNYATKRQIRINRQNPRHYEVLEGLEPGERVIVSNYDNFGDVDRLILRK